MFNKLNDNQKLTIFNRIWQEYVSTHGLGGMSKSDLDALFIWSFAESVDDHDHFMLGQKFKIKEARVKSLLATGEIKFDDTKDNESWQKILSDLSTTTYSVENVEKGQIRFHLKKQHYFRHIQRQARFLDDSFDQKFDSEHIIANLSTLYKILDNLWIPGYFGEDWNGPALKSAQTNIKLIIGKIGKTLQGNELEKLKLAKRSKLYFAIEEGAKLSSIGSFISSLYQAVNSQ
jgi:hypothetical protein